MDTKKQLFIRKNKWHTVTASIQACIPVSKDLKAIKILPEMIRVVFIVTLAILLNVQNAVGQTWSWAKNPGTGSDKLVQAIYTEQNGTSYITGSFSDTVMFGNIEKIASGYDFFLAKLDSAGNYIWVTTWKEDGFAEGKALTVDLLGNVYVTGTYKRAAGKPGIFGTGYGNGDQDIFVAKFSKNGSYNWASFGTGTGDDTPVAIELRGKILAVTGNYKNAFTVWDGYNGRSRNLQTTSGENTFLIVYQTTNGNINLSRSFGNANGARFCIANAIAIDSEYNISLAGTFSGTATFSNTTKNSVDGRIYLLKISEAGTLQWVNQIKSNGVDNIVGLSFDAENNILTMGNFNINIHFGNIHIPGPGNNDIFWAKYNKGGTALEAKVISGPTNEKVIKTLSDSKGNFYAVGSYDQNGTILGKDTLDPFFGYYNTFLCRASINGDISWISGFGGNSIYTPTSIGIDDIGSIYLSGLFTESLNLGGHVVESFWGEAEDDEDGEFDGFIAKYNPKIPSKYIFTGNGLWSTPENWHYGNMPANYVFPVDSVIIATAPGDSCLLDEEVYFDKGSIFKVNENSRLIIENDFKISADPSLDSTFTDPRDGNVYTIKKYGNMVWMTQDLRYGVGPCEDCDIYGRFYGFPDPNYSASQLPAPPGWHVPTVEEWQALIDFLGGNAVAGGAMKDTLFWNTPNLGATNSSGFNARAGGLFSYASWEDETGLLDFGNFGHWWTSTIRSTEFGTVRTGNSVMLSKNSTAVTFSYYDVDYYTLKIRCVKD
jgi:uncharacterized protein (TIGR02145 family)